MLFGHNIIELDDTAAANETLQSISTIIGDFFVGNFYHATEDNFIYVI